MTVANETEVSKVIVNHNINIVHGVRMMNKLGQVILEIGVFHGDSNKEVILEDGERVVGVKSISD